jgi:hypothetical protein
MNAKIIVAVMMATVLPGCGTYSSSSVKPVAGAASQPMEKLPAKSAANVILTEGDITDRPYRSLGDISVTVRKMTILDSDPTRAKVDEALKDKAATMGADAVVLVRYGTVGIGFTSWGVLDGNGRAVVFNAP